MVHESHSTTRPLSRSLKLLSRVLILNQNNYMDYNTTIYEYRVMKLLDGIPKNVSKVTRVENTKVFLNSL